MIRYIILFVFCFLSSKAFSNENLLTIQQQIERLQREVSDLSQIVFSNNGNNNTISENDDNLAFKKFSTCFCSDCESKSKLLITSTK